jgi:hypothetical protein
MKREGMTMEPMHIPVSRKSTIAYVEALLGFVKQTVTRVVTRLITRAINRGTKHAWSPRDYA